MSLANGAGRGAPASEPVGEFEGRSPSMKIDLMEITATMLDEIGHRRKMKKLMRP